MRTQSLELLPPREALKKSVRVWSPNVNVGQQVGAAALGSHSTAVAIGVQVVLVQSPIIVVV
jgi:hypothetical protein